MNYQLSYKTLDDSLKERFLDLWQRCLVPESDCNGALVYQEVVIHYDQPDRSYHNLSHLIHCLYQFDLVSHLIPHPDAVEMALWFHDLVYVPGEADNEQKSAEFFRYLASNCCSCEFINKVADLILITSHRTAPADDDECFIVDIDLSSMGLNWNVFLLDSDNLRKERSDVSDSEYCRRHNNFLKFLLARKRLFHTEFFYARYEQSALQNISRLLVKRESQGYR